MDAKPGEASYCPEYQEIEYPNTNQRGMDCPPIKENEKARPTATDVSSSNNYEQKKLKRIVHKIVHNIS